VFRNGSTQKFVCNRGSVRVTCYLRLHVLFEFVREGFLVQEYIGIAEFLVESVLHLLHTLEYTRQITVPGQHNYDSIGFAFSVGRRCVRMLIIVFWDWGFVWRIVTCTYELLFDL
jgi:hypothetical protein